MEGEWRRKKKIDGKRARDDDDAKHTRMKKQKRRMMGSLSKHTYRGDGTGRPLLEVHTVDRLGEVDGVLARDDILRLTHFGLLDTSSSAPDLRGRARGAPSRFVLSTETRGRGFFFF